MFEALEKKGHKAAYHCLDGRARSLKALAGADFDLIFNLSESYAGDDTKDIHIAAYLDLLGIPYTGSGPAGLHLAQDKAVAKRLFQFHGIRTPHFATVYRGRLDWADDIQFPVIVKPKREDGSIGIEFNAVVGSIKELMERIDTIHADLDTPVLIEEYVEGREFYVAVLGNDPPEALPIVELNLDDLPAGTPRIAGTEVKWQRGTEAYQKTKLRIAKDLPEAIDRGNAGNGGLSLPRARDSGLRARRFPARAGRYALRSRGESQPVAPLDRGIRARRARFGPGPRRGRSGNRRPNPHPPPRESASSTFFVIRSASGCL